MSLHLQQLQSQFLKQNCNFQNLLKFIALEFIFRSGISITIISLKKLEIKILFYNLQVCTSTLKSLIYLYRKSFVDFYSKQ
jgi:hypothetical protein